MKTKFKLLATIVFIAILAVTCSKSNSDNGTTDETRPLTATLSINIDRLLSQQTGFPNTGKECIFPPTMSINDLTKFYITLESLETGNIQEFTTDGTSGSFEFNVYGSTYKLTTTTSPTVVLPDYSDQFYWFNEQNIDISLNRSIDIVVTNQYSAIILINNASDILEAPSLNGNVMYPNANGWFIFSKFVGEETLSITKTTLETVDVVLDYEPITMYTYMFCDPLAAAITSQTAPFTLNKQIILN